MCVFTLSYAIPITPPQKDLTGPSEINEGALNEATSLEKPMPSNLDQLAKEWEEKEVELQARARLQRELYETFRLDYSDDEDEERVANECLGAYEQWAAHINGITDVSLNHAFESKFQQMNDEVTRIRLEEDMKILEDFLASDDKTWTGDSWSLWLGDLTPLHADVVLSREDAISGLEFLTGIAKQIYPEGIDEEVTISPSIEESRFICTRLREILDGGDVCHSARNLLMFQTYAICRSFIEPGSESEWWRYLKYEE